MKEKDDITGPFRGILEESMIPNPMEMLKHLVESYRILSFSRVPKWYKVMSL